MPKTNSKTNKKQRNKKSIFKSILKLGLYLCFFGFAFLIFYSSTVISNTPKINTEHLYKHLSQSSILYDDKGKQMDSVFIDGSNRTNISYNEVPENMINAMVSIEDKTFWKHNGFNVIRIFGAIKDSIFSGDQIGGTSTITQQLARNVYLSEQKSVRTLNRKVSEAWYTVILERTLTKKQIIEAYLNTIYFGHNAYGIESASQAYFNKPAKKLDLLECAALASIPNSPDNYSLVRAVKNDELPTLNKKDILQKDADYTLIYNGEASKYRRDATLKFMKEQGYISQSEYKDAMGENLISLINLDNDASSRSNAYFSEFVINQVIDDLIKEGYSEENARTLIYTGGLRIHTSLNQQAQKAIETTFSESSYFPSVNTYNTNFDENGNILSKEGALLLYSRSTYLANRQFTFRKDEYNFDSKGNMILKKNKRLNFYKTVGENNKIDYSIEFKPMYLIKEGAFYSIESGNVIINSKYKSLDKDGNLVISSKFFKSKQNVIGKSYGSYVVKENGYSLKQEVRQPQSAMVICDNKTGAVKAMVGGRNTTGKLLYNRAINPRQIGSSIKPLTVYSAALQQGAEAATSGNGPMQFDYFDKNQKTEGYGSYWTAASKINDAPMIYNGQRWPKNAYEGYKGIITMRKSMEISCNINAVRIFQQLGSSYSSKQLKKFGVTTIDTEGYTSDMNPAALALGGMTVGISPLEMASAYTTFPNEGVHNSYTSYTKVESSDGETLLESKPEQTEVLDKGVAFITTDMLRTTVANGLGWPASTGNQVTAGKTGTTSDNFDAWFCGFTPQYSAALWIGNDVNIELSEGSAAAARLWGITMNLATQGMSGSLQSPPDNVIFKNAEYFVSGTEVGVSNLANIKEVSVETCADSGYIATPWCTNRKTVDMKETDSHSKYYCPIHNQDPKKYPVAPGQKVDVIKEDEEDENQTPNKDNDNDNNNNNSNNNNTDPNNGNQNNTQP